jgi:translocation and assembly module TamB
LLTLETETSAKQYKPVEYREINGDFSPDKEEEAMESPIQINLDIHCAMPGQIYVRMPVLDSEWQGDIFIKGNLNKPEVSGYIKAISGQLDFLGKRFMLRESIINMNSEDISAPYLNVTAMTETNDVEAGVKVQGLANSFDLTFVSVPPLPEDEVLAYILFGRSAQEMNPVQAIELARYAALLGGEYSGMGIFGRASTLPGLDALTIRTGEELQDTQIGFGTYITDKLYVELLQGSVDTNASVEYRITPRIKFKGSSSSENESSIGLFWKRNY